MVEQPNSQMKRHIRWFSSFLIIHFAWFRPNHFHSLTIRQKKFRFYSITFFFDARTPIVVIKSMKKAEQFRSTCCICEVPRTKSKAKWQTKWKYSSQLRTHAVIWFEKKALLSGNFSVALKYSSNSEHFMFVHWICSVLSSAIDYW